MDNIELSNNIQNNIVSNLDENIDIAQKKFIETDIGKAVNSAIDIGLRVALPNLIEDQIIDIKNTIMEQGFSAGIKDIINNGIDIGKSTLGIINGNFESIAQLEMAVKKGGILDSISSLLDFTINIATNKNLISSSMASLIKKGKNSIISAISDKIEDSLTDQIKSIEKLEKYCNKWNISYENKDIVEMDKAYRSIKTYLNKTIPLEKTINEARKIENLHSLIKNNGNNFDITQNQIELAKKL